jgi:hypothetical protein
MGDSWDPSTPEEVKAKKAFESLSSSTDKVVLQTEPGTPNRFILRSKGYFGNTEP